MKTEPQNGVSEIDQLVDGPRLLEILFPESCRPTMRWLRDQQKHRRVPFTKIGRLVFFVPSKVRSSLDKNQTIQAGRAE